MFCDSISIDKDDKLVSGQTLANDDGEGRFMCVNQSGLSVSVGHSWCL